MKTQIMRQNNQINIHKLFDLKSLKFQQYFSKKPLES